MIETSDLVQRSVDMFLLKILALEYDEQLRLQTAIEASVR